jgi:hypothetical protein
MFGCSQLELVFVSKIKENKIGFNLNLRYYNFFSLNVIFAVKFIAQFTFTWIYLNINHFIFNSFLTKNNFTKSIY